MKSWRRALLHGVGVLLVDCVVAAIFVGLTVVGVFPRGGSEGTYAVFGAMGIAARAIAVMWFANLYFSLVDGRYVREGLLVGIVWAAVPLCANAALLGVYWAASGPEVLALPALSIVHAVRAAVWTPAITVGFGSLLEMRSR